MYYILIPDKNSVENFRCCYFPCMWAKCKQRIRLDLTGSNLSFSLIYNESYVPVLEYLRPIKQLTHIGSLVGDQRSSLPQFNIKYGSQTL